MIEAIRGALDPNDGSAPPVRKLCDNWRIVDIQANHWSMLVIYEEDSLEGKCSNDLGAASNSSITSYMHEEEVIGILGLAGEINFN